ncbi:MAG: SDR family oxidoreductase [Spirochaetaceae bacterium]|jgi:NAD(P)-dependent dehydrogenase (short-subunit alcohol dehydrogenase family)|nr:SDR family oxidoreductase [Spirochaetaceae bacterium]
MVSGKVDRADNKKKVNAPFNGKKALVIGGSGGIGGALSQALSCAGAELFIIGGTSKKRLERTAAGIKKTDAPVRTLLMNLNEETKIQEILSFCPEPDILVCAYGPFLRKNLNETDQHDWGKMVALNLILPGSLVSACLGGMMKRRWGRILLFGGTNTDTIRAFSTTVAYASAKTALNVLAKSVAKIASSCNISCNVICPGLTDTEYMDNESKQYNKTHAPGGKVLTIAEIASFGLDILKNPALNGGIFPIDHGIVL